MTDKPWAGRFAERTDMSVERFTSSIQIDRRLYPYDILGSIAHCRMLAKTGVITDEEASKLVEGLGGIQRDLDHGNFQFDDRLEDIHMHIEDRLLQDVGKVAQKLHTARSRNDQVVLDMRMFVLDATGMIMKSLQDLRLAFAELATQHCETIMPGYTHTQRAQPVILGHHLMAYYEMFTRDYLRFKDSYARTDVMPLGAAALAGTTYPIDPHYTAELLGFSTVAANSMDTVSDRDFVMEFLSDASICMVHLSRLSEELILWSSSEFGFVTLPDAFATGSSIMPQKKNPDIPELVRGKTGTVFGNLVNLLTMMKSLPLAYNRDMQEDKAPTFETADTLKACLGIYIKMLPKLTFNKEAMQQAASSGFLNATDMADYLVNSGMPFRKAHSVVGRAVAYALEHKKELHELSLKELQTFSKSIEQSLFDHLSLKTMVSRRLSSGGTSQKNVKGAIKKALEQLRKEKAEEKKFFSEKR
ncbi:MAG: argininosuccinate lyase [Desulfobacteraceae bacterium]|nr:argininosuccinate lyase [Desulfobacteraceae bacterium]